MSPKQYLTDKKEAPMSLQEKTLEYSIFDSSNAAFINVEENEYRGSTFMGPCLESSPKLDLLTQPMSANKRRVMK